MSFIISLTPHTKLFLGSVTNASDHSFLSQNRIGAVINCTHDAPNFHQDKNIKYLQIPIDDHPEQPIFNYFQQATEFALASLKNQDSPNILVHCQFGVSRSATITIAILMKLGCFSFSKAINMVQVRRPQVNPNMGFL